MFPLALKAGKEGGPHSDVNRFIGSNGAYGAHKARCRCEEVSNARLGRQCGFNSPQNVTKIPARTAELLAANANFDENGLKFACQACSKSAGTQKQCQKTFQSC